MDKKITIAIDGFSSTGKSTLAKELAARLGYVYVDSGAMYRAITLYAMQKQYITENGFDKKALIADLPGVELHFEFSPEAGFGEMYLNGIRVEQEIRTLEVSRFVSRIAEVSEVRHKLVELQQAMGEKKGIVMDGRDIGTVVFPDAELKVYMTASAATRAQRRFDELKGKGMEVRYEDVLQNVEERDHIDTHREDSPLRKADGAIEIDNSDLSRSAQLETVLGLVEDVLKS